MSIGSAIVWCCFITITCGQFTKLPNGLLITKQERTYAVSKELEVLIVIKAPEWPSELKLLINRAMKKVSRFPGAGLFTTNDRMQWMQRLTNLRTLIPVPSRKRRGLLDFVGKLSKSLFGTATSADVERIAKVVETVAASQGKVLHRVNDLLMVVNKSNGDIQVNRDHLLAVQKHISDIYGLVDALNIQSNRTVGWLNYIKKNVLMERTVASIERYADHIVTQQKLFFSQKLALESELRHRNFCQKTCCGNYCILYNEEMTLPYLHDNGTMSMGRFNPPGQVET